MGGIKEREDGQRPGGGRGDYSREAIILNIAIKGGRLFEGRLLFEEIRYFLSSLTEISIFRLLYFI